MARNIYYFRAIQKIGGTEQFLYEIAKKYCDYDIEVMYEEADESQIARLKKYVRCTKWHKGEIVECDKYFANFNLDQAEYVKAREYYFVVHANFEEYGYMPNIEKIEHLNPKFIGVSKYACDKFTQFTGKPCELCYNPLTLEPKEKVIHLVSACRLNDSVKGGERTQRLIKALDEYCAINGRHYIWHIFTNDIANIPSLNVSVMKPRIDVRPFIQDADIVLQLSNDMETYCYTTNEAWSYGVHTITTPLSVLNELPIPEGANYVLDWNCENINDVVRHIFEDELKPFTYKAPQDRWNELLEKGASKYKEERYMKYKVKALKKFETIVDNEVGRVRNENEVWIVDGNRKDVLLEHELIEIVEELKDEVIENAIKPKKEVKKAVKKSTRK